MAAEKKQIGLRRLLLVAALISCRWGFGACVGIPLNHQGNCTYAGLHGDDSAEGVDVQYYDNVTSYLNIQPFCGVPEDVCDCAVVAGSGHPCAGCGYFSSYSPASCHSDDHCTTPCGTVPELGGFPDRRWASIVFALLVLVPLASLRARKSRSTSAKLNG